MRYKKTTIGLVLFMLMILPLTMGKVDLEEVEPVFCIDGETMCEGFYTLECRDGHWWLPELIVGSCGVQCLENSDCDEGLICHAVFCVVDPTEEEPVVTPPVVQPSRRNRNPWTDKTCSFEKRDTCKFRFKINQLVSFTKDSNDYTIDYVKYTNGGWYRNIWKLWRQSDPIISITDVDGNSVYYGTPEEGDVLFDNLELTGFDYAGYFVWMTIEQEE